MSSPIERRKESIRRRMEAVHEKAKTDRRSWVSKFMPLAAEALDMGLQGAADKRAEFQSMKSTLKKFVPGTLAESFYKALLEIEEMTVRYRADRGYLNYIRLKNLGIMGKKDG